MQRANLHPVLYEGLQPGGQLTTTTEVENYPGYPEGVTGPVMMEDLKKQAMRFGTDVRWGMATKTDFSGPEHKVWIDDSHLIEAETVIIATGATAKYLGLEDETKYAGGGVSACATCDGFFYRGKDVAVVGGGDTAAEEAMYLAGLCRKVYLIVRRDVLRASKVMADRVSKTANIEVLWKHQTKGLFGDGVVEGATLVKNLGEPGEKEVKIKINGFFLAIGHTPNSEILLPPGRYSRRIGLHGCHRRRALPDGEEQLMLFFKVIGHQCGSPCNIENAIMNNRMCPLCPCAQCDLHAADNI